MVAGKNYGLEGGEAIALRPQRGDQRPDSIGKLLTDRQERQYHNPRIGEKSWQQTSH